MKFYITQVFIFLLPVCVFGQKFSTGASIGLISIDNNNGVNGNLYVAYHLNDKISIGGDALFGNGESKLITNAYMAYVEAGNSSWSLDSKHIFYFSGILGLGNVEEKVESFKEDAFAFYAGTKINVNLHPNFIFGIKSGIYLSKLEYDPIIANLFFTYKF